MAATGKEVITLKQFKDYMTNFSGGGKKYTAQAPITISDGDNVIGLAENSIDETYLDNEVIPSLAFTNEYSTNSNIDDVNNLTTPGIWNVARNTANVPVNDGGFIPEIGDNSSWTIIVIKDIYIDSNASESVNSVYQFAYRINQMSELDAYIRLCRGNIRSDWVSLSGGSASDITVWHDTKTEGEFYKADDAPSSTVVGKYDGYFYATRVYNAVYNDYAELFPCVEEIEVGHIAYATEKGLVAKGKPKTCVGIVSDQYGHLLGGNGDPDDPNFVPIAVAGRVPLHIKGDINIGDCVKASNDGTGKKARLFTLKNKIIGKVVGPDPQGRPDYVEVLVGGF